MFNLLAKLRASKARKAAAKARYDLAQKASDTQAIHHAGLTLKGVQTERLRLEMGR